MKSISAALDIIKTRNKGYYVAIGIIFLLLFVMSFIYGYNLYHTNQQEALDYMRMVSGEKYVQITLNAFYEKDYIAGFLLILGNNLKSVAAVLFSGILLIFPILFSASQALALGTIMGISAAIKPISFIHAMLTSVVACLEFSTIFIACYEGTNLGLSLFRKKGNKKNKNKSKKSSTFKQTFVECLKIFVLIIAILAIAAVIETIGIAAFGTNNV